MYISRYFDIFEYPQPCRQPRCGMFGARPLDTAAVTGQGFNENRHVDIRQPHLFQFLSDIGDSGQRDETHRVRQMVRFNCFNHSAFNRINRAFLRLMRYKMIIIIAGQQQQRDFFHCQPAFQFSKSKRQPHQFRMTVSLIFFSDARADKNNLRRLAEPPFQHFAVSQRGRQHFSNRGGHFRLVPA